MLVVFGHLATFSFVLSCLKTKRVTIWPAPCIVRVAVRETAMSIPVTYRIGRLAGVVLILVSLAGPSRAQDADDAQRGVARISLINGDVSVRRGDSGDWVAGVINAPLLTADQIA